MAAKRKSLVKPGEPKQKTRKGLEIPVPTREEFFRGVKRTIRKSSESAKSSH